MFRKISAAIVAAGLVAAALAGCSSAGDGKTTLRFATPDSGPGAEQLQSVVDAYNASQSKVTVKLEAYGDAFDQKISAQVGSGNVPDMLKMWNFPQYYTILEPMNDFIDTMKDKSDFYPVLFNYADMKGKIYGFPTGYSTRAIYYNSDLASKAGLTPPASWTSEDFTDWVKKIGALGGGVYGYAQPTNPDAYSFESLLFSNGGEWLDNSGKPVVNSKANLEVIKFYHDLAYGATADVVRKGPSSDDLSKVFMSNQLGTFEFGKWYTDTFTKAKTPYGILPMFSFNGKTPKSVVHAAFVSISKTSKHKAAAEDFIRWMSSPENVTKAAKYDLPIRKSVAGKLGLTSDPINKPFFQMLENSADTKSSLLKSAKWPDISTDIAATLETIFSAKDVDIKAEMDKLQAKLAAL